MKNHDCSENATPVSSPSQTFKEVQHVIWDCLYEHDRVSAILLHLTQLLDLVADHEDETPRLNPTLTAHLLRDTSDHLEMLKSQINYIWGLTDRATPGMSDVHQPWESLRRVWAACDENERKLVLRTARVVQGNIPVHAPLTKFLQDLTKEHQSQEAEDDREE